MADLPKSRGYVVGTSSDDLATAYFVREHRRLDEQLRAHLLDIAGGDFLRARQHLQGWYRELARHIGIEEARLLPHVPGNARWAAQVYHLEHRRITELAGAYAAKVDAITASPPRSERSRREAVLALLDAVHALRHVLEHHHQREELALANELPLEIQEAAWSRANDRTPLRREG